MFCGSLMIIFVFVAVFLLPDASGSNTCQDRNYNLNGPDRYVCKRGHRCLTEVEVPGQCRGRRVCCDIYPCWDRTFDWILMFDDSGSIDDEEFAKQKDFAKNLVDMILVGPSDNLVGAMTFNDEPRTNFFLSDDAEGIKDNISNIQNLGGGTDIAKALEFAIDPMLLMGNGNRWKDANLVLMITDGNDSGTGNISAATHALMFENKTWGVVAIGVGDNINIETLRKIASRDDLVFHINRFAELSIELLLNILGIVCTLVR